MPGNSYAFELIERLGLPKAIIEKARARLGEDRNKLTEIISRMETDAQEIAKLRASMGIQNEVLAEQKSKFENLKNDFEVKRKIILNDAKQEAQAIIKSANAMIENAIREVKSGAQPDAIKQIRESIAVLHKDLSVKSVEEKKENLFEIGDKVKLKNGANTIGEVYTLPDSHSHVVVQFGAVKMRVYIGELEKISNKVIRKEIRAARQSVVNSGLVEYRIDVRGMYGDDAIKETEQAITSAINANMTTFEILHGKGTGALRERIHAHLNGHPAISSFRIGTLTEGGAGVTIVELK